jgi:hypothetical protein
MSIKDEFMAAFDKIITPELAALADAAVAYAAARGTVTPTDPPPATVLQLYTTHGIACTKFLAEKTTVSAGEPLWFQFRVNNTTSTPIGYEILAPRTEEGQCAQSWTVETLQAGQELDWRDHIDFTTPGTYHLYMGVGFTDKARLIAMLDPWFRLSDSIVITVV